MCVCITSLFIEYISYIIHPLHYILTSHNQAPDELDKLQNIHQPESRNFKLSNIIPIHWLINCLIGEFLVGRSFRIFCWNDDPTYIHPLCTNS